MKRILGVFLIFTVIFVGVCALPACNKSNDVFSGRISEYRDDVYEGEDNAYSAELITGYRENPFNIDGKAAAVTNYTLVTIVPKSGYVPKLEVKVECGEQFYTGTALRHPYKDSLSYEFPTKTTCEEVKLYIKDGEKENVLTLKSIKSGDEITGDKALSLAYDVLKEQVALHEVKGVFQGEIFVRFIKNPLSDEKKYFWYVSFVPESDPEKIIAVLLDPISGEARATKK